MKILINAANLHVGGGVQVATSAITEMIEAGVNGDVTFAVSSEVAANIGPEVLQKAHPAAVIVIDVHGLDPFNVRFRELVDRHDVVFTVFGPLYRRSIRGRSVVGFAQPWIIYPDNEVYGWLPLLERLKTRLRFWMQSRYYERADHIVVELDHVKEGLVRELGIDPSHISVVRNCVSSIYQAPERWLPLEIPETDADLRLGFLGRDYLHKNTRIFPAVVRHLREKHDIDARFYVTFTEAEWAECESEFRDIAINVGPITVAQCPRFYEALDAVVFPSLLECFSATPLEAMVMERPLFASDRPFNRNVCQQHATYFDPDAPEEVAEAIAVMYCSGGPDRGALQAARDHAVNFSSPVQRAEKYLELLGISPGQTK